MVGPFVNLLILVFNLMFNNNNCVLKVNKECYLGYIPEKLLTPGRVIFIRESLNHTHYSFTVIEKIEYNDEYNHIKFKVDCKIEYVNGYTKYQYEEFINKYGFNRFNLI